MASQMFLNSLNNRTDKINYLEWVVKQNKLLRKQLLVNEHALTLCNDKKRDVIKINSFTMNKFVIYNNDRLIIAPQPFIKISYLVDLKTRTCTCPSFKYNNYRTKGTCKHLEKCRKVNETIITIALLNKTHFYGVPIPVKKMIKYIID